MARYRKFTGAVKGKGGWDMYKRGFTPARRRSLKKAQAVANRNRSRAVSRTSPVGASTKTNSSPSYKLAKVSRPANGYRSASGGSQHSKQYQGYLDMQTKKKKAASKKRNDNIKSAVLVGGIITAGAVGGLLAYKGNQMAHTYVAKVRAGTIGPKDVAANAPTKAAHATGAVGKNAIKVSPDIQGTKAVGDTTGSVSKPSKKGKSKKKDASKHPSKTNASPEGGVAQVATPHWSDSDVGIIQKPTGKVAGKGNLQPAGYSSSKLIPAGGFGDWTHAEIKSEYGQYTADRYKGKQITKPGKQIIKETKAKSVAGTKTSKEASVGKPMIKMDAKTRSANTPDNGLTDEKTLQLRRLVNEQAAAQVTRRQLGADKIAARVSGDYTEGQRSKDLHRFLSGTMLNGPSGSFDGKFQMNPKNTLRTNVRGRWMPVGAGQVLGNDKLARSKHPVWSKLNAANEAKSTAQWKTTLGSWATKR